MDAKRLLVFVSLACGSLNSSPAVSAEAPRIFDCVRFAPNGNSVIADNDCVVRGLRNGADPNWISREHKEPESTLSHFVTLTGFTLKKEEIPAILKAVETLVRGGARLQLEDAGILYWPVARGQIDLVRILLDMGASPSRWPNKQIGTELSPIEMASSEGKDDIVALLAARGATKPDPRDALQGKFIEAAFSGTVEDLSRMISQGAKIDDKNRDNQFALANAISSILRSDCEAYAKVHWLLEHAADATLDGQGRGLNYVGPPLHQAVWYGAILYRAKRSTVCVENIVRELIKHDAQIAARDSDGQTPLHIAARQDNVPAARILLESGSTVMPRDARGRTPLDLAVSAQMIMLLKQHGAVEH